MQKAAHALLQPILLGTFRRCVELGRSLEGRPPTDLADVFELDARLGDERPQGWSLLLQLTHQRELLAKRLRIGPHRLLEVLDDPFSGLAIEREVAACRQVREALLGCLDKVAPWDPGERSQTKVETELLPVVRHEVEHRADVLLRMPPQSSPDLLKDDGR